MTIPEPVWRQAVETLTGADAVALACHVDPDGDALGSMLALHHCLTSMGKTTAASWGTTEEHAGDELAIPPQYAFLPGLDALVTPEHFPARPDVMVAFDTGTPERLGSLRSAADHAGTLIVIDHHSSGKPFGDVRLVDGALAASAVIVAELIRRLGHELDREIAICLYTALVTDTGRFQYASTTPEVLELAARLVACDIDHAAINRQVWNTHSFGYLKLLAQVLGRAQLEPRAQLLWTSVTQEDLRRNGVAWHETEGLIEVLRSVESAQVAMIAKEQFDGVWKVSLRSRGHVDVGRVARELGGGGHSFLAGFLAKGDLEELTGRVSAAVMAAGGVDEEPEKQAAQ